MYLTVIAWIYVVLMMSIAEATSTTGTVLGAIMTFLLYGVLPLAVVMYLMGTPSRRRAIKAREREEALEHQKTQAATAAAASFEASSQPDAGSHAAGAAGTTAAVREKP